LGLLPAGDASIRLRDAVPPATAEVDESARDDVWPSDTDVESRRIETTVVNWYDRRRRDFMSSGLQHVLTGLSVPELLILNTQYGYVSHINYDQ